MSLPRLFFVLTVTLALAAMVLPAEAKDGGKKKNAGTNTKQTTGTKKTKAEREANKANKTNRAGQDGAGKGDKAGDGAKREKPVGDTPRKDGTDAKPTAQQKEQRRENEINNRENRQDRRINAGIAKGQLTPDEVTQLQKQETDIKTLESSLLSDGKLSKDDFKQLNQQLDTASHMIWADRHNTDGNQMPVYRLGKEVFAKDSLTQKLADPNISAADAKQLLGDIRQTVVLKRRLATEELSAEDRTKLQAQYDDLINRYFELRPTA